MYLYGIHHWHEMFNSRQLVTLVVYVEIIKEAKTLIQAEYDLEKAETVTTYLALFLDRCVDKNARLSNYDPSRTNIARASAQHSLNLMWNYPKNAGDKRLWESCSATVAGEFDQLCSLFGTKPGLTGIPELEKHVPKSIQIDAASADSLTHIPDKSLDAIVTTSTLLKARGVVFKPAENHTYQLTYQGQNYTVTFKSEVFEQTPSTRRREFRRSLV